CRGRSPPARAPCSWNPRAATSPGCRCGRRARSPHRGARAASRAVARIDYTEATVRVRVESAEVHTLKANGRPWDGPGGSRIASGELARFFALDLNGQLERLVDSGDAPNPPDVTVRLLVDGKTVLETDAVESFDPSWPDGPEVELAAGTALT